MAAIPTQNDARLVVVGANHRSSAMALRDRLFVADLDQPAVLGALGRAGLTQAIVLSTCDRVEIQAAHGDPAAAAEIITRFLVDRGGEGVGVVRSQLYALHDEAALRHIAAVAASLDSLILGEPQVLGQVKAAHRVALAAGMVGPELEAALQAAYATAKRVRSETAIAEGPVSMAAAAVQLARDVHGDLGRIAGLLIGTADMGELLAEELQKADLARLSITASSLARAEETARRLGCHVAGFEPLAPALRQAEVVVTASGSGRHVVTAAMMNTVMRERRRRPVFIVDLGVPADVERAVEDIDGVFRYDLDDLERIAMAGRASRASAAAAAGAIVDAEIAGFLRLRAERSAVPALIALRRHFEAERERALRDAGGDAARATELLVNRLLHAPSEALRQLAAVGSEGEAERIAAERLLRRVFRLIEPVPRVAGLAAGDDERKEFKA